MSTADSTAAFFAKKKKKKAFKGFNANKIDASTVTTTVHVDAPAVSTDPSAGVASALAATSLVVNGSTAPEPETDAAAAEQWDDEALAAATTRKAASQQQTAELLDMKALDTKRRVQDDIAERMRVEETKAALAAAREGMEREAQRLKESEDQKKEGVSTASKSRFGAAASSSLGGTGGKWVAPHMRSGTAASLTRSRMGGMSQKLDTKDEELFPDLASAEAILEQQQKQEQTAYKVPKKTPVGGGASWGSNRLSVPRPAPATKAAPVPEPNTHEPPKDTTPAPAPEPASTPKPAASKPVKPVGVKSRKKKDLSTFKPS